MIKVSLRTPGRGMMVEGPSGIGKTCAIMNALTQLDISSQAEILSARKKKDVEKIKMIFEGGSKGVIIIDDFHKLPNDTKNNVADYLKTLADEESQDIKIIIIGINRAGDSLIRFARDLVNRIDIIRFETNPFDKIVELITKGERALNIEIESKDKLAAESYGSFYLAQLLSREVCMKDGVLEKCWEPKKVYISADIVKKSVYDRLSLSFSEIVEEFAAGPKFKSGGRAPYLHILKWLGESESWSISLKEETRKHPEAREGVSQVIGKGYMKKFMDNHPRFDDVINFDDSTNILTAEDPQFIFYIRNIKWTALASKIGFKNINFDSDYDFALSFSGVDRAIAEKIFNGLAENEFSVFYDKNEQHRILAEDIEEYLGPIYKSQAKYVVCLLSSTYPTRIWAKFESEQFKHRFGEHKVIPIMFNDAPPSMFDETSKIGGFFFDPSIDVQSQVNDIVSILTKKMAESNCGGAPTQQSCGVLRINKI
jgi:hypothetical protein